MKIFFILLVVGAILIIYRGIKKIMQILSIVNLIKKITQMENSTDNKEKMENTESPIPPTETEVAAPEIIPTDVTPAPTFDVVDTTELPLKETEVPTIPEPEQRADDALNIYPSKTFKITTNGVNFMNGKVLGIAGVSVFRAEPLVYVFSSDLLGQHNLKCVTMEEADQFYSELIKYEKGEYGLDAFSEIAKAANDTRPLVEKAVEKFEAIIAEIPVIKNAAYYGFRKLTEGEFFSHAEQHLKNFVITKYREAEGYFCKVSDNEGNEVRLPKNERQYLPVE